LRRFLRSLGQVLDRAVRILTIVWMLGYLMLAMAYVAPVNPVKLRFHPLLAATVGTYFSQNWSLFAPTPISVNNSLLAKCLDTADGSASPSASGWKDLTTPMAKAFQQNRFSAYDRVARPAGNSLRQFMSGGPELTTWYDSCRKGVDSACQVFERGITVARRPVAQTLATIGSAFCNARSDAGDMRSVALRMRVETTPAWADRGSATRNHHDIDLGTYAIDRTVVPMTFLTP